MKLGGILTSLIALLVAGLWAVLFLGSPDFGYAEEVGNAVYVLSFPFGWFSKMFSGGHNGKTSDLVWYFLLMIPNSFLWGYTLAAIINGVRSLVRRTKEPAK